MRCSFKNIRINVLLAVVIMTLDGRGNPVEEMQKLRKKEREKFYENGLIDESPMYVREKSIGKHPEQAKLEPKTFAKRQKVSLTHFPAEISRRKEDGFFIRQTNVRNSDNTRRGVPVRHLRESRFMKGRGAPYRNYEYYPVDSAELLKKRRKWFLAPRRSGFSEGGQNAALDDFEGNGAMIDQFEPCCRTGQAEDAAPQTYMVEVEPTDDVDEGGVPFITQPQLPLCNKYYYVFEKKPFKVKFLNFVSSPGKDCISPLMKSAFNTNTALKLSMPAFQCRPPECREVLYCKYFQCTSLGFFPDSRNCRKYFFCDLNSSGFVLYHMLCPRGRIFDPSIRECRLKEMMDKRDVHRCWLEAAKLKREEKARIKKNESGSEDLITYKEGTENRRDLNPKKVRRKSLVRECDGINNRHNPKHMGIKKANQSGDNKTTGPILNCPPLNFSTKLIPIPVLPTLPKYCETTLGPAVKTPPPPTESTLPPQPHPQQQHHQQPHPPPPPISHTTLSIKTTIPTTTTTSTTTTTTTSSPPTTIAQTTAIPVSISKPTVPICPPPKRKNITCPSENLEEDYMSDLDSEAYQDDAQEDEYCDEYYDVPEAEDGQDADYEWLKQSLNEYLDLIKSKKEKTEPENEKTEIYSEQSPSTHFNDYTSSAQDRNLGSNIFLPFDADRGKRSEDKTENVTVANQTTNQNSVQLPDFEKCYNEKKVTNLDGYPCKQYGRYPDKYDSTRYYECGAQPDGNMKIEHKRCPKGEEFSPEYLECIATEYLKVTHRKKRVPEMKKPNKQRPTPEPEYNYEDDKEIPNEWLDASHGNKVPNEFKSKTKHTLRIFHLHCKRNSSEPDCRSKRNREGAGQKRQNHKIRSFIIRPNKKEDRLEEDEDEEYEDDEEDYYDLGEVSKTERSTHVMADSSSTTVSSKILLDADIRVDREFENTLKNIIGKTNDPQPNKNSILIRLSGNKAAERWKRNFIKDLFSKKSKTAGEDPEKEGVVSMLTLINGLPSEYEREALLQKLERRKMMNSHLYRNRQRTLRKRKKIESENEFTSRHQVESSTI